MKRIAIISVHGCPLADAGKKDTGGMSIYVRHLASKLGELDIGVDVYTRAHNSTDPQIEHLGQGARVIHILAGPFEAAKRQIPDYLNIFLEGLRRFKQSQNLSYDLIHSHHWLSGMPAMALSQELSIPHVSTFHTLAEIKRRARVGEYEPSRRIAVEHQMAKSADRIIVSTTHERQALRHLYGIPEERISVIHPGVDLDTFYPGSQSVARERLGLNGERTLLFVGRMEPIKGIDVLLHTVANLEEPDNIRLLVVGGNNEQDHEVERLKKLSQNLLIDQKVDFLGRAEHTILPLYYQAADVAVVPSYYESFGLVALEAMACGTPVVASRVGGLQTLVKDSQTGYLVPWHCPDAFAYRLEMLLANEILRHSMGRAAHTFAKTMGWDRTATAIADVYEELCRAAAMDTPITTCNSKLAPEIQL